MVVSGVEEDGVEDGVDEVVGCFKNQK